MSTISPIYLRCLIPGTINMVSLYVCGYYLYQKWPQAIKINGRNGRNALRYSVGKADFGIGPNQAINSTNDESRYLKQQFFRINSSLHFYFASLNKFCLFFI